MRLLATFAAIATVNAYINDDVLLKRTRRDGDDECDEGEVEINGFCTSDLELAEQMAQTQEELEADDDEDTPFKLARRFPMSGDSSDDVSRGIGERAKRRTQRMTLIMAICPNGKCGKGAKMKPRDFMKRINNYGCHCWTKGKDSGMGGKGAPVDDLDRTCAELSRCHTCINVDYPEDCDPVTQRYKAKLIKNKAEGTVEIKCTNTMNKRKTNNGDCKRNLCECDKAFAEAFTKNFESWTSDNWEIANKPGDVCQRPGAKIGGSSGPPNQCCGAAYPFKKPYNNQTHHCVDDVVLGLNQL